MIFIIRLITASCFFALLGKANIWLNPASNVMLALGYRSFLILSPFFARMTKQYSISLSLLLASLGVILFLGHSNMFFMSGAILLGIGVSISSYLIRAEAAETVRGAANNKIAANLGAVVSGLILLCSLSSKNLFFSYSALALFVSSLLAFSRAGKQNVIQFSLPTVFDIKHLVSWILIGLAVGIKLFGVFSVLPQFLLAKQGVLPGWYGSLIFTNALAIIFFQLPIIHFIEKFRKKDTGIKFTLIIMLIGMLLIAFPGFFWVNYFIGSLLWTFTLSLIECVASYLDVQASRSKFLLIKETAVGIGGGLTVFLSRGISNSYSSILIGLIGIASIVIAFVLLRKDLSST